MVIGLVALLIIRGVAALAKLGISKPSSHNGTHQDLTGCIDRGRDRRADLEQVHDVRVSGPIHLVDEDATPREPIVVWMAAAQADHRAVTPFFVS